MKFNIDFHDRKVCLLVKHLLKAGLKAADPILAMNKVFTVHGPMLRVGRRRYDLRKYDRIMCVGAGKASGKMAMALEQQLGPSLSGGLVAVKDRSGCRTKTIQVVETSHPIPDRRSVKTSRQILRMA
jgi:glycerate 2-kinase